MGVGTALSELGRFLDEVEGRDAVTRVAFGGADGSASVAATLELTVDPCAPTTESGFTPGEATVGEDGTISVSFDSTTALLPVDDHDVEIEHVRSTRTDGATVVELRATVPTDPETAGGEPETRHDTGPEIDEETHVSVRVGGSGSEGESETTSNSSTSIANTRSRDVPPFRDTELLREVYETCDTFSEMPEALGMDVTAETVRRYMIRQGIHEPTSYDTSTDEETSENDADEKETAPDAGAERHDVDDAGRGAGDRNHRDEEGPAQSSEELESPAVLADGIGLPDDVTIDTIVEAVQTSNTIYEVKQGIGIEREDALEMLRELNLLEFVAGRLATEAEREVSRDQIIDRLREQADAM